MWGTVPIIAYNVMCNCTEVTKIFIDNKFINNGIYIGYAKTDYSRGYIQIFCHELDTTLFSNGIHELKIVGKHDVDVTTIHITIENPIC